MEVLQRELLAFTTIIRDNLSTWKHENDSREIVWNSVRSFNMLSELVSYTGLRGFRVVCMCPMDVIGYDVLSLVSKSECQVTWMPGILWSDRCNLTMSMVKVEQEGWSQYRWYYLETLGQFVDCGFLRNRVYGEVKAEDALPLYTSGLTLLVADCFLDEYWFFEPLLRAYELGLDLPKTIIVLGYVPDKLKNMEYVRMVLSKAGYRYGYTFPYMLSLDSVCFVRYIMAAVRKNIAT